MGSVPVFPGWALSLGGILKAAGWVNRVSKKKREVAITFLDEMDQDSLYSL